MHANVGPWVWRTPLAASQPFWEGWYKGLSDMYMSVITPKILVLAGTDRLDRPLTVGQMQGKFQLVLLPQVLLQQAWRVDTCFASVMQSCHLANLQPPPSYCHCAHVDMTKCQK